MEAGESPARSRHCKEGVLLSVPLLSGMKPAREGEQSVDVQVRRHAQIEVISFCVGGTREDFFIATAKTGCSKVGQGTCRLQFFCLDKGESFNG